MDGLFRLKRALLPILFDDRKRQQRHLYYLDMILALISSVMSVINIATGKTSLLIATALMAFVSFINGFVVLRKDKRFTLGIVIFTTKMFVLLTYFIINGGTEGFSTIWLLLVPACGMFAFGRKLGAILSGVLFLELVAFFYTPLRDICLQCTYTNSFLVRFPVVYACFFAVALYLEYVRAFTNKELVRLRDDAYERSLHDTLTGLYNRLAFDNHIYRYANDSKEPFALLIIDIDLFKNINDSYGHFVGDQVLRELARRIRKIIPLDAVAYRWGGEELAVLIDGDQCHDFASIAEEIRCAALEPIWCEGNEIKVSISIGGACSEELEEVTSRHMLVTADRRLYQAKGEGRNKCICE